MPTIHSHDRNSLPLAGCHIVERARSVAAAYAGRLLATLGATVVMLEPEEGSPLSCKLANGRQAEVLVAPYRFQRTPLKLGHVPPPRSHGEKTVVRESLS